MYGQAGWRSTPGMPALDALDADQRRREAEHRANAKPKRKFDSVIRKHYREERRNA